MKEKHFVLQCGREWADSAIKDVEPHAVWAQNSLDKRLSGLGIREAEALARFRTTWIFDKNKGFLVFRQNRCGLESDVLPPQGDQAIEFADRIFTNVEGARRQNQIQRAQIAGRIRKVIIKF